jgi:protease IV
MLSRMIMIAAAVLALAMPADAKVASRKGATTDPATTAASAAKSDAAANPAAAVIDEIRKADNKARGGAGKKAVSVTIAGTLAERGESMSLFSTKRSSLKDYLDVFRRVRDDGNVRSLVVRFSTADFGLGMAQELRAAIEDVRSKGKKVYGVIEDDSQVSYLVATACDEIILPPSADLMLYGVKADAYFFRSLLEKIGVSAQIIHVGQYKSFGEMFTEDDFTTPARANMDEVVGDIYSHMVDVISKARKMEKAEVEGILNRGPQTAEEAKAANLIDRIAYADELQQELTKSGMEVVEESDYSDQKTSSKTSGADLGLFSMLSMLSKQQASDSAASAHPQVAVVYAVGPIMLGGKEGMSLGSSEEIYSEDFIEMLEEIRQEPKIKAVILRVNSPGGSAFASDLIWRKLQELKKSKPVIVSMGDVAASGGYYIAMAGSKVFAQAGTITGSIGVVGGKLNLGGGYEKLGIRKTTISRGEYANLFSETANFSPHEREAIEKMMRRTYDDFVSKAATDRNLPKEKLNELAQGKIWLGERAKSVGLVDEVGGINSAIQEAKKTIGLRQDEKVSLVPYPKHVGLFDLLQKAFGGAVTANSGFEPMLGALSPQVVRVLSYGHAVARMFHRERVLTVMPFVPHLN